MNCYSLKAITVLFLEILEIMHYLLVLSDNYVKIVNVNLYERGQIMSKLLVFGHQNPDTDAITSAISYAYLLRHLGEDAEAVALRDSK